MAWRDADPLEWLTAAFGLAQAAVIGLLVSGAASGAILLAINGVLGALVLSGLPRLRRSRRVGVSWLAQTLPLLVFYIFYREIGVALAHPGVIWHDEPLARLEAVLRPPLDSFDTHLAGPWFAMAYMLYVPLLLATAFLLFRTGVRHPAGPAQRTLRSVCLAWAACYIIFLLHPVMGPRHLEPRLQLDRLGDGAVASVTIAYQDLLLLRGAAFPSAHVAATVVCLLGISTWRRDVLIVPALLGSNILLATLYLGYHYTADVMAGVLVGLAAFAIDGWWTRRGARVAA